MIIKKEVMAILLPLVKAELEQVSFYKQISIACNDLGFLKAQKYFLKESNEEMSHFDEWLQYIVGRGNNFSIPEIPVPTKFNSDCLCDLIQESLQKEEQVSELYNSAAIKIQSIDQLTYSKILWFLNVQNEAIQTFTDMVAVSSGITEENSKSSELILENTLFN